MPRRPDDQNPMKPPLRYDLGGHSFRGGVMFGLGVPELLLILVIVVLIFGTSRIPELGRGLGEGIRNFRKGIKTDEQEKKP
jgi:sec-independent protein translocase protein TatA